MFKQNFIIGNTPMIKINYKYKGQSKQIFVKLEYYNLTGSIKDRVVFYMINNAKANGILKEKMPLIEATINIQYMFICLIGLVKKECN